MTHFVTKTLFSLCRMMKESYFRLILITTASLYHVCSGIKNPLKEGELIKLKFLAILFKTGEFKDYFILIEFHIFGQIISLS